MTQLTANQPYQIQCQVVAAGRYMTCGENGIAHVWSTHIRPPLGETRCCCGQLTWAQGIEIAYQKWLEENK